MKVFAGVDIGSTYIKIALVGEDREVIALQAAPTGSSFRRNAVNLLDQVLDKKGLTQNTLKYTVATGYGRKLFREGNETISEISANAAGARFVAGETGKIRTVINIGGQDSKVILLNEDGTVLNFGMNDKCAAGTGKFLEMASRTLQVDIEDLAELHLGWNGPPATINSTCTVFAESEIVSKLSSGHSRNEIAAGVHFSVARRIARLAHRVGIEDLVMLDGGAALNAGVVAAIEQELMRKVFVPENSQMVTAMGAALIALESAT